LDEQKERNIPGGGSYISFGMREYRAASMKGLSGAIEEVERGGGRQEQQVTKPVFTHVLRALEIVVSVGDGKGMFARYQRGYLALTANIFLPERQL